MGTQADLQKAATEQGLIAPTPELTFAEKYPLHAKLDARKVEHGHVQSFLNWIYEEWDGEVAHTSGEIVEPHELGDLIGAYLEIDPQGFQAEKDLMLQSVRETGTL